MSHSFFKVEIDSNQVAQVVLTRSELHNAFNDEMIIDLTQTFKALSQNNDVRAVLISAQGKSFCAGADLNWMKKMVSYSEAQNQQDALALSDLFKAINECVHPVVAKVHGAALGGGVGVVSACDIVIASSNAIFGFSEVKLGLIPAVISPFVIAKIGESAARRYFLTGERMDAQTALRIGLIHEVVTAENLDQKVDTIIFEILNSGKHAVKAAKDLVFDVVQGDNLRELTAKKIAAIRIGSEAQEGMNALLEKRKPNWVKAK